MRVLIGVLAGFVLGVACTIAAGCYFGVLKLEISGKAERAVVVDGDSISVRK